MKNASKLKIGKSYQINYVGEYDYNNYMGEAIFTGESNVFEDSIYYGFSIVENPSTCFFSLESVSELECNIEKDLKDSYNAGLDTAISLVGEAYPVNDGLLETILCGLEESKKK